MGSAWLAAIVQSCLPYFSWNAGAWRRELRTAMHHEQPMGARTVAVLAFSVGGGPNSAIQPSASARGCFYNVCQVILHRLGRGHQRATTAVSEEDGWSQGTGPLHMLMHNAVARDAAWANKEEAPLLNLLVLQQFVEALPAGIAEWVHYHQQASLKLSITLAKDHWKFNKGAKYTA